MPKSRSKATAKSSKIPPNEIIKDVVINFRYSIQNKNLNKVMIRTERTVTTQTSF